MQNLQVKNTSTWLLNNRSAKYFVPLAMFHNKKKKSDWTTLRGGVPLTALPTPSAP